MDLHVSAAVQYLFLTCVVSFLVHHLLVARHAKPTPRGPWRIPLVGSVGVLGKFPPRVWRDLSRTYGDVMSLYVGSTQHVVLSSASVVREALVKNNSSLAARPPSPHILFLMDGSEIGITAFNGEKVREHRRFLATSLKDLGMGKSRFEVIINKAIDTMLAVFHDNASLEVDPAHVVTNSVADIVGFIAYGPYYDNKAEAVHDFMKDLDKHLGLLDLGLITDVCPWLLYVPGFNRRKENKSFIDRLLSIIEEHILVHKEDRSGSAASRPRDFIDIFLDKAERLGGEAEDKLYTDRVLCVRILEIYLAGFETTATTLRWAILYLSLHPKWQTRLLDEINDTFADHEAVTWSEKKRMPQLEAFINELLRLNHPTPFGLPRWTLDDVTIDGHHIPAHTHVIYNIWALGRDARVWERPEEFDPQRFLDEDGKLKRHSDIFFPFLLGRRRCIGESLARMELFLFISNLVRRYHVTFPRDQKVPDNDGVFGLTAPPTNYRVVFDPRSPTS